ncbi:MAG TPA: hypothetical protein VIL26_04440 [Clostridia bacterium]
MKVCLYLLLFFFCSFGYASEKQAITKALTAAYYQLELDDEVKRLEKKYVPETVRKYGGVVSFLTRIAVDKRITYTWEF